MFNEKRIFIYVLFCLILSICCTPQKNNNIKFRCNSDIIESKPIPAKNSFPISNNLKNNRYI